MKPKNFSIKRQLKSFKYAFKGLFEVIKNEHNARIHLLAAAVAVALGFYFDVNEYEWLAIVLVMGMTLITEIINTSIEELCDMVHPEWHEQIGRVKDYAAGAVLVSAIVAIVVACIIFLPKIF